MPDFEFAVLNEFKQITTQIWVHWQENKKVFINFYYFLKMVHVYQFHALYYVCFFSEVFVLSYFIIQDHTGR